MGMIGCFRKATVGELDALAASRVSLAELLDADEGLDVDKAWAAIHFLLTGTPDGGEWPLYDVVLGGNSLGIEHGYGPARFHTPADAATLASALADLTPKQLRGRFDAERLTAEGVYPEVWHQPWSEDYVIGYYEKLRDYYRVTADEGAGMILFL